MGRVWLLVLDLMILNFIKLAESQTCPAESSAALFEARSCFNPDEEIPASQAFTLQYWNSTCVYRASVLNCLDQKYSGCGQAYIAKLSGDAMNIVFNMEYYWRYGLDRWTEFCDADKVNTWLTQLFQRGGNVSCLSEEGRTAVLACISDSYSEIHVYMGGSYNVTLTSQEERQLTRWALSSYQCVLAAARTSAGPNVTCDREAENILVFFVNQTIPRQIRGHIRQEDIYVHLGQEVLSYQRSTVGVFGDPHLMVYGEPQLMSCSLPGQQLYLSNQLLDITGVNSFVLTSRATTLTSVSIEFRVVGQQESQGQYEAGNSLLPTTFTDGSSQLNADAETIRLSNMTDGVQILSLKQGYLIQIRQWKDSYLFTLRMADRVFNASTGILVAGCPKDQMFDVSVGEERRRRSVTELQCQTACANVTANGYYDYHETCVFDCETAEDPEIAEMSANFAEQVETVEDADRQFNLMTPSPPTDTSSSTHHVITQAVILMAVLIINQI